MSNPHLSVTLAKFSRRIQKTKDRLVAVPAEVQRQVGLDRRANNHILLVSLRPKDDGRWNHHLVKLTYDCEFSIPSDATRFVAGSEVDVKVHRVIPDESVEPPPTPTGAGVLLAIAGSASWRSDGAARLDEHIANDIADRE
jgi:hypothetical protein